METVELTTPDVYNKLFGLRTLHPLVSVIDLTKATRPVGPMRYVYGVYAVFLKHGTQCSLRYGRRQYDYQEGTIVTFAPGQTVDVVTALPELAPDVKGLMFHPDIAFGTPLAEKISRFGYFDYSQTEALHLSDAERAKFLDCLSKIAEELEHPVDNHSGVLLSANIQVLLEYLDRFYDRQFITRHKANSEVVARFERQLRDYYREAPEGSRPMPGVAHFAALANLTPGYFGDLVKKETGSTPKEIITLHLVTEAKRRLMETDDDVSEIAYALGFDYPAHFSRMFKRVTGQSPRQYREAAC